MDSPGRIFCSFFDSGFFLNFSHPNIIPPKINPQKAKATPHKIYANMSGNALLGKM
jgi:hypothetical protein